MEHDIMIRVGLWLGAGVLIAIPIIWVVFVYPMFFKHYHNWETMDSHKRYTLWWIGHPVLGYVLPVDRILYAHNVLMVIKKQKCSSCGMYRYRVFIPSKNWSKKINPELGEMYMDPTYEFPIFEYEMMEDGTID